MSPLSCTQSTTASEVNPNSLLALHQSAHAAAFAEAAQWDPFGLDPAIDRAAPFARKLERYEYLKQVLLEAMELVDESFFDSPVKAPRAKTTDRGLPPAGARTSHNAKAPKRQHSASADDASSQSL